MKHIKEEIESYKKYKEDLKNGKMQGILTPYSNLNEKLTNGIPLNTITTIAALSGVGKTALLINLCFSAPILNKNIAVLIFSLEMPSRAVISRILASKLQMSTRDINSPKYDIDYTLLEDISKLPIYVDSEGGTPDAIYNKIDGFIRNYDSNTNIIVALDHALLTDGSNENEKMGRLTGLLNKLKLKYVNSNYIILSQLNDSVLKPERLSKKGLLLFPQYTDLMYARQLFHISDTVLALNSPYTYIDEELNSSLKTFRREYGGFPLYILANNIKIPIVYGHIIKGRDTGTSIIAWGSQLKYNDLIELNLNIND